MKKIVNEYQVVADISPCDCKFLGTSASLKRIVTVVPEDKTQTITILDIGFGAGDLGEIVKSTPETAHWHVDGIDGFIVACSNIELFNKRFYRNIWYGYAQNIPRDLLSSYSMICLFDVIEHLDPVSAKNLLILLLSSLGEDGRLVLSTPLWFFPQDHTQTGDMEEHLIGIPAKSLLSLDPLMCFISSGSLIGTFVFSKKSLDYMDCFLVTTDKNFNFEAGLQHLSSLQVDGRKIMLDVLYIK
jgi:2-polyprenyl-3-methyl-5-hydroxy-6-metoxy-1,4-benzoquinol methylase